MAVLRCVVALAVLQISVHAYTTVTLSFTQSCGGLGPYSSTYVSGACMGLDSTTSASYTCGGSSSSSNVQAREWLNDDCSGSADASISVDGGSCYADSFELTCGSVDSDYVVELTASSATMYIPSGGCYGSGTSTSFGMTCNSGGSEVTFTTYSSGDCSGTGTDVTVNSGSTDSSTGYSMSCVEYSSLGIWQAWYTWVIVISIIVVVCIPIICCIVCCMCCKKENKQQEAAVAGAI